MISIRHHQPGDWAAVWPILRTAIASGDTLLLAQFLAHFDDE
ncbi:MAG: hypothetical protein ABI831_15690 [Betaproteobacteria bacterium]